MTVVLGGRRNRFSVIDISTSTSVTMTRVNPRCLHKFSKVKLARLHSKKLISTFLAYTRRRSPFFSFENPPVIIPRFHTVYASVSANRQ